MHRKDKKSVFVGIEELKNTVFVGIEDKNTMFIRIEGTTKLCLDRDTETVKGLGNMQ